MLSFPKLTRCYYQTTKEMLEQHKSPRSRWLYALEWAIFLYSFRVFFVAYVLWCDFETEYNFSEYDIVLNYLYHNRQSFDAFFFLVVFLFELFNLTCYRALYELNVFTITWRWWYQLVVVNQDAYYEALICDEAMQSAYYRKEASYRRAFNRNQYFHALVPQFCVRLICRILVRFDTWVHFENVHRKQLFSEPLSILPKMSDKLRRRLLLWLIVLDKLCFVVQLIISFLYFLFFLPIGYHYFQLSPSHPWYVYLWFSFEVCLAYFSMIRLLRAAFFFTLCSIIGTLVYTGHVIDVGRTMHRLLAKFRTTGQIPFRFKVILDMHLQEYGKVCNLVIGGSNELFGKILFTFLLTNIPINIYFVCRTIFRENTFLETLSIWLATSFQIIAGAVVFGPLAWCCMIYHSPAKFIPQLQPLLVGYKWLLFKLKYDDLYNRLVRGPKIAIGIGPVSAITYLTAFQFFCLYIAYMLITIGQIITVNIENKWAQMREF